VLLDVTREAFVQGLHLAAAISAVVAIGAAFLVVAVLWRVPASFQVEREQGIDESDEAIIELDEQEAGYAPCN
jgi:hypothetical protein